MARRCGRTPKGERLRAGVPHGLWKTTTLVGALGSAGMVAAMVLDGPVNGVRAAIEAAGDDRLEANATLRSNRDDDA